MRFLARPSYIDKHNQNAYIVDGAIIECSGGQSFTFTPDDRGITVGDKNVGLASDTKTSNFPFVGEGGDCSITQEPCVRALLPSWSDPVESVVYTPSDGSESASEEKQEWIRGRGQYTILQQTATLDKWSVVYCTKGGVLRPSTNGQAPVYTEKGEISIDEKVHVIIADRRTRNTERPVKIHESEWYLPASAGYCETASAVNNLLYQTTGIEEVGEDSISTARNLLGTSDSRNTAPLRNYDKFCKHPYECKNNYANIFLPFVFKDVDNNNLSTERKFRVLYKGEDRDPRRIATDEEIQIWDVHLRQALPDNYMNLAMRQVAITKQAHEDKRVEYRAKYNQATAAERKAKEFSESYTPPRNTNTGTEEELQEHRVLRTAWQIEYDALLAEAEAAKEVAATVKEEYNDLLDEYYTAFAELTEYKSSGQQDYAEKLEQYRDQCNAAQKFAYMIRFGKNAKVEYLSGNYTLLDQANYGLWGQWYEEYNGWHRGIDVCPGGTVHAILSGQVCDKDTHYIAIYNRTADVTLTYMHLSQNDFVIDDEIDQWEELGTQDSIAAGTSAHTHLEVNPGRVESDIYVRPWSRQDSGRDDIEDSNGTNRYNCTIADLIPGVNFASSPYGIIESVWGDLSAVPDVAEQGENGEA